MWIEICQNKIGVREISCCSPKPCHELSCLAFSMCVNQSRLIIMLYVNFELPIDRWCALQLYYSSEQEIKESRKYGMKYIYIDDLFQ